MVLGHKLLIKGFKNMVKNGRLSHGYVFFGPEGVGKKTFGLALANFLENQELDYTEGKLLSDLFLILPDENKTIGINVIKEARNFLFQKPNRSLKRTLIIDEAEFLTTEAQNALLKITEEPPASSLLILIVRDPEILMPTLASRLQRIYFSPLSVREVEEWLEEKAKKKEPAVSRKIIEEARGSLGLAMRMLSDDEFNQARKSAEKFLKLSQIDRKNFIKELLEPESFDVLEFLDSLILALANDKKIDYNFWHKVLRLRRDFSNFPLNPKLQLLNL